MGTVFFPVIPCSCLIHKNDKVSEKDILFFAFLLSFNEWRYFGIKCLHFSSLEIHLNYVLEINRQVSLSLQIIEISNLRSVQIASLPLTLT